MAFAKGVVVNASVAVVIPAYNAQSTIAECVSSVRDQTDVDLVDIVVVDDGSNDGTADIAGEFGCVV